MNLYDQVRQKGDNHIGTIVEIHTGQLTGMASVKYPGGTTCVTIANLEPHTTQRITK